MRVVKRIIERPVSVVMLILAVVVFGTSSLTGMPLEYMPDMELPMEMVMVTWAGADADSMDRLVTQVIEDKCESLSNVDSISSVSNDNYAMVILSYNYGTDLDEAYSDLRSAMDMVMMELPSGCDEPTILEMGSNSSASIMASVSTPEGLELDSYLDDTVIPALESLGGVAQVEVMGSRNDYIRIVLDEAAMKQYGLSISDIGSAIATADFDMPVGDVTLGTQNIALGVYGSVDTDMESLRSQGLDIKEAAIQGTSTMLMSILAGTLTTVVVYIPWQCWRACPGRWPAPERIPPGAARPVDPSRPGGGGGLRLLPGRHFAADPDGHGHDGQQL